MTTEEEYRAFDQICERGELDAVIAETDKEYAEGRALTSLEIDAAPSANAAGENCAPLTGSAQKRPGTRWRKWMRRKVWERDKRQGEVVLCHWCKRPLLLHYMTLDHVVRVADGGHSREENIVPSCKKCNHERHGASFGQNQQVGRIIRPNPSTNEPT